MKTEKNSRNHNFPGRLALVYKDWKSFIRGNDLTPSKHLSNLVIESWKRSRAYGIDPFISNVALTLKGQDLKNLLAKNKALIDMCMSFMEILYSHVRGSGFSVVLFDSESYMLSMIGDDDILAHQQAGGYKVGSCWSEEIMGANASGTCVAFDRPIQICACEHFCRLAHGYSGSTAPIHDPEGNLLGVINMTGVYEKVTPHTLGAVVSVAQAIEKELCRNRAIEDLSEAYDLQKAIFESSQEAMIAIAKDKTIKLVNEKAKKLLKIGSNAHGKKLRDLFPEKENNNFKKDLLSGSAIVDREYTIVRNQTLCKFTVSSTPITSPSNQSQGSIITLNEIKRARNLVTNTIGAKAKFNFRNIIGNNPDFLTTLELGKKASKTSSNLLLLGESGTGKDIFAQAIHQSSSRKNGPYITINCGAIPRELITSELFGYTGGAFTGSKKGGSPGKFELADGGSLFLDEIGEMPLELQIVLMRVIEERRVTRIGGKVDMPFDVRIIAATNKNLREEVAKGNFREDLYFRLNVFTIEMLPLRSRKDDIPLLTESIVDRLNNSLGSAIRHVDDRVMESFMNYDWPGNVRELQNVIERMMNLAPGSKLTADLLPMEITNYKKTYPQSFDDLSLEALEQARIIELLKSNLTKDEIARQLKIARSTLYLKIKKYGLQDIAI
jgi:transcriptional regulator of acetoin/glycerol metabolism